MSHFTPLETRTARKEHRCDWCFTAIERGESHRRWAGTEEGQWFSMRVHLDCRAAMEREWHEWGDDSVSLGERHQRGMTLDETEAAFEVEKQRKIVLMGSKS